MVWWHAGLWALAGGFVVEGLEFAALQRRHRRWPWQVDAETNPAENTMGAGPAGYFIAELVRLIAGGVLGAAMASQITAPLPALALGAAAPIVAGNLAAYIPLPAPPATNIPPLGQEATSPSVEVDLVTGDLPGADGLDVQDGEQGARAVPPETSRQQTVARRTGRT